MLTTLFIYFHKLTNAGLPRLAAFYVAFVGGLMALSFIPGLGFLFGNASAIVAAWLCLGTLNDMRFKKKLYKETIKVALYMERNNND